MHLGQAILTRVWVPSRISNSGEAVAAVEGGRCERMMSEVTFKGTAHNVQGGRVDIGYGCANGWNKFISRGMPMGGDSMLQ